MSELIHVVSFDVPYPDDYGGVIDVFNQIRWLKRMGFRIMLHAFSYGRPPHGALLAYCEKIHYYGRGKVIDSLLRFEPHIVQSRRNTQLLKNLSETTAPILFQGQHCTAWLGHNLLDKHRKVVRLHNIEHRYYQQLAQLTNNKIHRLHHQLEATLLKKAEKRLQLANALIPISAADEIYYRAFFPNITQNWIAPFHPEDERPKFTGEQGNYVLFHGNLLVAENRHAALELAYELAPKLNCPLYIAGKADDKIIEKINLSINAKYIPAANSYIMKSLIQEAKANVLITQQNTGLKLKLLHALYLGHHLVTNRTMLHGTGLENEIPNFNTLDDIAKYLNETIKRPWLKQNEDKRNELLSRFSNNNQAKQLVAILMG